MWYLLRKHKTGDAAISGKTAAGFTSTTVSNREEQ